jgi:AraC-like DNA-binding protein
MIGETGMAPIGQAVGHYAEFEVIAPLKGLFSCAWIHQMPFGETGAALIVPDGCSDLILADGHLRLAGPDRAAIREFITPGAEVVGLRFAAGGLRAWLGIPAAEFVNARLSVEAVTGASARLMAEEMWGDGRLDGRLMRLQTVVARELRNWRIGADDSRLFATISAGSGIAGAVLPELKALTGLSERTLRRRCLDAFGYGPKTLERILRFQRFLALVRSEQMTGLAGLAADAGYADQAHLTRDVRALSGLTPKAILEQLRIGEGVAG